MSPHGGIKWIVEFSSRQQIRVITVIGLNCYALYSIYTLAFHQ
jgi:hypothetical protein